MSRLIYDNIILDISKILSRNGETRSLSLLRMTKKLGSKIREPLIFDHVISGEKKIFRLPLTVNQNESIKIDWGDGEFEDIVNRDHMCLLHVVVVHKYPDYPTYKKYRIVISGGKHSVNHIGYCSNWADKITDFITLGNLGIADLSGLFRNCNGFNGRLSENFNTVGVTDMSWMFCGAISFNQSFPAGRDTGNVRDMRYMFYSADSFNRALNFNTSNVTDMCRMFAYAENFNSSLNFNTKNVRYMYGMFSFAKSFNQRLNFDIGNVKDMENMFHSAISFNIDINWKPKSSTVENLDR